MVLEKWNGLMALYIKENLKKEKRMEMENLLQNLAIYLKVILSVMFQLELVSTNVRASTLSTKDLGTKTDFPKMRELSHGKTKKEKSTPQKCTKTDTVTLSTRMISSM
jgi:hypothetical protein